MENEVTATAEAPKLSHNEVIDLTIKKIQDNDFNIFFYAPSMNTPSGGIGVLLKTAKNLRDSGHKVKIVYEPLPQDDPKQRKPNITKAQSLLGWEPKIGREEGLKATWDYFKKVF